MILEEINEVSQKEKLVFSENKVIQRLKNSPFIEQLNDTTFKLKEKILNQLQRSSMDKDSDEGNFFGGSVHVPSLYPVTELYLMALLGDNTNDFIDLLETYVKQNEDYDVDTNRKHPIYRHDYGWGLPADVKLPLQGKKLLFIGGGNLNDQLLCRYYSDGAEAVNIDPEVLNGTDIRLTVMGKKDHLISAYYNHQSAKQLDEKFGKFDAVVVQNVFDYGSVDDSASIEEIISPLSLNIPVGGLALISIYDISSFNKQMITRKLLEQGFTERAILDEMTKIKRGQFKVWERVKE